MFYVYEWFNVFTNEIFYVGKGTNKRYKVRKHNKFFNYMVNTTKCDSRIVKYFCTEKDAFEYEYEYIKSLKYKGQCCCNIIDGGTGGTVSWWTHDRKIEYSEKNIMKSSFQRNRMKINNPMFNNETVEKVAIQNRKKVVADERTFNSLLEAANYYGVSIQLFEYWISRGYTKDQKICYYLDNPVYEIKLKKRESTKKKGVYIDNIYFESVRKAAKYIGITGSQMSKILKSNSLYKNHTCKYGNQQPSQTNTSKSSLKGSTTNE